MSATPTNPPGASLTPRLADPGPLGLSTGVLGALGMLLLLLSTIGFADLVGMADYQGLWLVAVPAVLLGAFLAWLNERIWVHLAILGHVIVFTATKFDGIGAGELGFTAVTLAGLCVWFFKETVIHRRVIIRTGFDLIFLATWLLTTVVAFIANQLHDGEVLRYMIEWSKMFDLLLYFPVRKFITTRRDIVPLVVGFSIIALVTGVVGVTTYRQRLMEAVFTYQVEASRVFTNEPISMLFTIIGAVIVAYSKGWRQYLLGVVWMMLGLLFLAITFSRGAILSAIVGIVVVVLLGLRGRRVVWAALAAIAIGSVGVYLIYPNIAKTIASSIGSRIGTIGSTMTDVSFNLRVIEANRIIDGYVVHSPMIGYGYGVNYHWYDPTIHASMNTMFIHNGYVRLLYKHGLPLALLFLAFMVYPVLRVMVRAPSRSDEKNHALMVGCVAYLVCSYVNHYVSDMYSHYAGPLNFVLCWAVLDFVNRRTPPATASMPLPESPREPVALAGA